MRKLFIVFVCCTGLLLFGYVGYRSYKIWQQQHFVTMARQFMAASDSATSQAEKNDKLRNAMLSLSLALRANPHNVEACRLMAGLSDAVHAPGALVWRSKVVELNPASMTDRIALAQTAMAMKDFSTAGTALAAVSAVDKKSAIFQNTAGALAAASNRPREAEAYFQEAVRLEPQNPVPQLNLAVLRMHSTNALEFAQAKDSLQRLAANPTNSDLRCSALRELVAEDLRSKQNDAALALTKQLLQETNAVFSDKLLRLSVLFEAKSPEFKPALAAYQAESQNDPVRVYELAVWQLTKIPTPEVLSWLRNLPPASRTNQQVELFTAECSTLAKDWAGMQAALPKQNWGEVDFLRHAFLSRAYANGGMDGAALGEWGQAVNGAKVQEVNLTMLLHVAVQFGLNNEAEDLLWIIVKQYSDNKWAPDLLVKDYYSTGKTKSLEALWRQQLKATPTDLRLKNNLANVSMLLNNQDTKPYELAHEAYVASPTNANFATTYAFALYLQGKNAAALKIFEQLKPQELEMPETAGYYGFILKANGDSAKAKKYLALSAKANLLPEEKKMFDKARNGD